MLATLLAAATLTSASLSLSSLRNGGRTSDLQLCIDESLVKVWGAVSHKYYSHAMLWDGGHVATLMSLSPGQCREHAAAAPHCIALAMIYPERG